MNSIDLPVTGVLSVTQLNRLARQALESRLPLLWVAGEISNLTIAASGHAYFTLKDSGAAVRGVMFRSRAQNIGWSLKNGDQVEAQALVTLYEARGDYQLNIEALRRSGAGNLYEQFLRLKEKLSNEGLFSVEKKRALPVFPRCIGLITSAQGAALRDIVSTLQRRAPHIQLILYPCAVQGLGAPAEIIASLGAANQRKECDLLLLCRGGGSLEDLWAFNDEKLARAIAASTLPVIAGIGHETDFSIADFVADLRAPTPTAAAELAAPERDRLSAQLAEFARNILRATVRQIGAGRQRLDLAAGRLKHPTELLQKQQARTHFLATRLNNVLRQQLGRRKLALTIVGERLQRKRPDFRLTAQRLAHLQKNLITATENKLSQHRQQLLSIANRLNALSPHAVMARGYSLTTNSNGQIIKTIADTELNAKINVYLADGLLAVRVEEKL